MATIQRLWLNRCEVILALLCIFANNYVLTEMVCPAACACNDASYMVDCSGRNLMRLPIDIDTDARILNISGNRIVQLIPLPELPMLAELDLSFNSISYLENDVFQSVPRLVVISLNHNRLEYIPAVALAALPALRRLSLSANRITTLTLNSAMMLNSLQFIDLSYNRIFNISSSFVSYYPNLEHLNLAGNHLNIVDSDSLVSTPHALKQLDLSYNNLALIITGTRLADLELLNVSGNRLTAVDSMWFRAFPSLTTLYLDHNQVKSISDGTFSTATNLRQLSLNYLNELNSIEAGSLLGLSSLEILEIHGCSSLSQIHTMAFADLQHLQLLDLSNNQLTTISHGLFTSLPELRQVRLSGNRWNCDCILKLLRDTFVLDRRSIGGDIICSAPPTVHGLTLFSVDFNQSSCNSDGRSPMKTLMVRLGYDALIDCELTSPAAVTVTWFFGENKMVEGRLDEQFENGRIGHVNYGYVETSSNLDQSERSRIKLMGNGSLVLYGVMRHETGYYYCTASDRRGNFTTVIEIRLDYSVMTSVMQTSFIIGFVSAAVFFLFAAILGFMRYLAYVCSPEERAKRRSLRELLAEIRGGAHVDRFTAYRSAKMDQFAAFKSATMDQLASFKTDRIGRLRKYKQATVSAVLHQLEKMREHYAAQTARIKESYAMNVDRLRENYSLQRSRFHDRRSVSVQHIRKQYRARAERAREYSVAQVARLREQYKQQQQYFLKLLELIDVGSCVSQAVEVECMRAESAIFDAGAIAFDEEARPSHATRGEESLLFDTASLPDGFPVNMDSSPEISNADMNIDDDDGDDDFLPPLDIRLRSFSASNVREGRVLLSSRNVQVHRDAEHETAVIWKKSESTPVICVVQGADDAVIADTVV